MKREAEMGRENSRVIGRWWSLMKMKRKKEMKMMMKNLAKKKMKMKRKLKHKMSSDRPEDTEFVPPLSPSYDLRKETQLVPPPCPEETKLVPPLSHSHDLDDELLIPPPSPPLMPPPSHLFGHDYYVEDLMPEGEHSCGDAYYFSEAEEAETMQLFDAKHFGMHLVTYLDICDCPTLVKLYAEMGLHRYNLLEKTSYQFDRVQVYFRIGFHSCATYLINLLARQPPSTSLVLFQTRLTERSHNTFDVACHFATPEIKSVNGIDDRTWPSPWPPLPAWPLETHFEDKFYEKSEWEANDCCILLYLKLAFFATSSIRDKPQSSLSHSDPSALKIVNVVVETTEQPEPPNATLLKRFMSAVFYITYDHDLAKDGVFSKRRAVVRRTVDPITKR